MFENDLETNVSFTFDGDFLVLLGKAIGLSSMVLVSLTAEVLTLGSFQSYLEILPGIEPTDARSCQELNC